MCIAILNTSKQLPDSYIKNSWDNNDQGAGLLWNDNGVLKTYKTFSYKSFLKKYKQVRKATKGKVVLHFRIATSGYKGLENLHPFLVNEHLGFVHNGVIGGLGNMQHSDTYQFNEMLKDLPSNFLESATILEFISAYIGGSKLVFLSSGNTHTIINERMGHWVGDDWFSNTSYESYNDYVWAGNTKVSKSSTKASKLTPALPTLFDDEIDEIADQIRYYYDDVSAREVQRFVDLTGCEVGELFAEIDRWCGHYQTFSLIEINDNIESNFVM
jgi:hypothetical protein